MALKSDKVETKLDRKECQRRVTAMQNEASSWLSTWKDISLYENPTRGFFSDVPNQGKQIDHKTLLDSFPKRCIRTAAAGVTSGMTSPARPWFKLGLENDKLAKLESVKIWLSETQQVLMNIFSRSNIYGVLNLIYEELFSFGTGTSIIVDDPNTVIRGHNFTIGEYWLSIGPDGRVNGFAREYWMTVGQLVKQFGEDNVSPATKSASKIAGSVDKWIQVVHLIEENDDRVPDMPDFKNMAYRSIQWEKGSPENLFLKIGGFDNFPILAPRIGVTTTSDVYGKGTGWDALGDSKMLQKLQRKKLLGIDKTVDPPVQKDGMVSGDPNTLPGGVTTSSASVPNAGVRPVYQIKIDLADLQATINETKQDIASTFYTDLFLMLSNSERTQITAREVVEKHEEKLLQLGPLLESLEDYLLDPLIDIAFAKALAAGLIPDPPPELEGQNLKVEYISILAQAQKMVGTAAIEQLCGFIINLIAGGLTEAKDKLDVDEAIDNYADMLGIPPRIVRSSEAVLVLRKAAQEALQNQQMAESASNAINSAKTLSESKLGEGTLLDNLIAAATGKKPQKTEPEKVPAKAGAK